MDQSELPPYDIATITSSSYEVTIDHGALIYSYNPNIGIMLISNLDVSARHRRQGIGKNLLRIARFQAQELGARAVLAAIVSSE